MGYLLLPEAESDLDGIWLHIARDAGNAAAADRLLDALADRFWLLGQHPEIGRRRDQTCGRACAVFRLENTLSSTGFKQATS